MNTAYQEFAFIAFMLMGAFFPVEKSLDAAQLQLAGKYPASELIAAKETVIKKITTGFDYVS